jgi:acetylglutamate kinase
MTTIIKVGGHELEDESFLSGFAQAVAGLPERPVIVHGGGKELTTLLERLGTPSRFIEGLRVTDEATLAAAEMVLRGRSNLRLVRALVALRLPALGLSGVDGGLVLVEKLLHPQGDLGYVGRPVAVEGERLRTLLLAGFLPVLAPLCIGADGQVYNVNADHVAAAVAAALDAERLLFLTNVTGVLIQGDRAPMLTASQVQAAIADGNISGGMVPKVRSALEALEQGVRCVVITNLAGLESMATGQEAGTAIVA